jgi:ferredoxin
VSVDRDACLGARVCLRRAPATFSSDAAGRAVVADPAGDSEASILEAAQSCPNFAIHLRRDGRELA